MLLLFSPFPWQVTGGESSSGKGTLTPQTGVKDGCQGLEFHFLPLHGAEGQKGESVALHGCRHCSGLWWGPADAPALARGGHTKCTSVSREDIPQPGCEAGLGFGVLMAASLNPLKF